MMNHNKTFLPKIYQGQIKKQSGMATLFTTMAILLAVTLITLNTSRMSALELSVSRNYESQHTAFNRSESALDALFTISTNIVDLNDDDGVSYCTANNGGLTGCDATSITAAEGWPAELINAKHQAQITLVDQGCAPRWLSTSCAGSVKFAQYTMTSHYDDTANNAGASQTVAGAMELVF